MATASEEEDQPKPWRLWWWYSTPPPPQTDNGGEVEVDVGSPTNSEAALILLNELISSEDVGQVLTQDRVFCRLSCAVERCRLVLDDGVVSPGRDTPP